MLQIYRDNSGHVAGVYDQQPTLVMFLIQKAKGTICQAMSLSTFRRTYTKPLRVEDYHKTITNWYSRAAHKPGTEERALNILEIEMLNGKELQALTKEEVVEAYNTLASANDMPTVEDFLSLKHARNEYKALAKSLKPVKEPKVPSDPEVLGRGPVQGVGNYAKELLLSGMANKEVLADVLAQFPSAKTSAACIGYYRTKLVEQGLLTTQRAKKAAEQPAA